jgi:oligopeptide/dipeptide ABC transporter ATP-binding protein
VPLLEVRGLKATFFRDKGVVVALDGLSCAIDKERTLGVVGESGCGKSVLGLSIMGLVPSPPGSVSGEILFHRAGGVVDLAQLPPNGREMCSIRGREIAMIFQEPMTSLDPTYTIGKQIMEAIILHQKVRRAEARTRAIQMLRRVGIPLPHQCERAYPHQLSGGMCQRAVIAMALSCHPSLLIADEPTTALDVTIQAQVLELMTELREQFNTAIQFVTHDLAVIACIADDVIVMYLGRVVESASAADVFHDPRHPYTQGLIRSIPSLGRKGKRLRPIEGAVPGSLDVPLGCGFEPRCSQAVEICRKAVPPLTEVAPRHTAACWLTVGTGDTRGVQ